MTKTIGLTGFETGDSFSMSVSQSAITVGPIAVPSWGQANTGGTITINADRTVLQCAPDSVRFLVDLSAATFDAVGPTGSEVWDARLHDLIYLWDFGDAGNWGAPVNVLSDWKARTTAKGPFVAHMFRTAGTYSVSLTVYEPSTGKLSTTSTSIVVADPDTVYAGAKTLCINPTGDNDFTGKPIGATEANADIITTDAAPWTTLKSATEVRRVLLKRGGTYTVHLVFDGGDYGGLLFGAYGFGPDPVINSVLDNRVLYGNDPGFPAANKDFRVEYWNLQGNFNPTAQLANTVDTTVHTLGLSRFDVPLDYMLHSVSTSGTSRSVSYMQQADDSLKTNFHADNCTMTNFGGQYPMFFSPQEHMEGSVSFTGCRIAQNPDAVDDPSVRANIRINHAQNVHLRGCDLFSVDSSQPCIKLIETPSADGTLINVHSCSFEGGLMPISFSNNTTQAFDLRTTAHNMIVDGVIAVGAHKTRGIVICDATGLTLRNSLLIQPGMAKSGGSGIQSFLYMEDDFINPIPQVVLDTPVRMYNNTLVNYRITMGNGGSDPLTIDDRSAYSGGFTNVMESNNVVHQPNADTPVTTFAPLSTTQIFTPRNKGKMSPSFGLDAQYASPSNSVQTNQPESGSVAINAATTGDVAYQDITGANRATTVTKGAWNA